jgi:hypothetical protein
MLIGVTVIQISHQLFPPWKAFITFNNLRIKNRYEKEVTVAEIVKLFVAYVKFIPEASSKSGTSRPHCSNTS